MKMALSNLAPETKDSIGRMLCFLLNEHFISESEDDQKCQSDIFKIVRLASLTLLNGLRMSQSLIP
jgi:hypothetical protein